jgi:signal transduction histidine kinase
VRNALRHANASQIRVLVTVDSDEVVLTVTDDGIGFDPAAPRASDSFGLRGLRDLANESGGVLAVDSTIGEGTVVALRVAAQ